MKQPFKNVRLMLFGIVLSLSFLHPVMAGFSGSRHTLGSCPDPGVSITGASAGSISFGWNAVSGATGYRVWYVRQGDNFTSQSFYTSNTSITFSGLPSGTYDFHFQTICGESDNSQGYITEDIML